MSDLGQGYGSLHAETSLLFCLLTLPSCQGLHHHLCFLKCNSIQLLMLRICVYVEKWVTGQDPSTTLASSDLDQDIGMGPTQLWLFQFLPIPLPWGKCVQIVPTHRGSVNTSLSRSLLSSFPIPSLQQNNFFPCNKMQEPCT